MILIDFSQIIIGDAISHFTKTKEQIDDNLLRHISLNNIVSLKKKLHVYSDEMILCLDGGSYWRKKIFPPYKQNRKKNKIKDNFDWDSFYKCFNQIKQEFKENLPYKVIEIPTAEADDIIAVLSNINPSSNVVIVSSDKDFLQIPLNIAPKVKQYSVHHKSFIDSNKNDYDLFEHIVRGDSSDGIPNILSDDDVFLCEDKRSKAIRSTTILKWKKYGIDKPEEFCEDLTQLEKFQRNRTLIDLRMIPAKLKETIKEEYINIKTNSASTFNYLVKHKLKKIIEIGV